LKLKQVQSGAQRQIKRRVGRANVLKGKQSGGARTRKLTQEQYAQKKSISWDG
jgi:hypothetical protein